MPLHVDIRINDRLLTQIHIGRLAGGSEPDSINTYAAVEGEEPKSNEEWLAAVRFEHRYGDGAEVCVRKALMALESTFINVKGKDD